MTLFLQILSSSLATDDKDNHWHVSEFYYISKSLGDGKSQNQYVNYEQHSSGIKVIKNYGIIDKGNSCLQ